ncbi:MAG: hypothetical protein LBC19_06600 [Tannerella sp.]|nr:hypothetical protein [Tannerella sp.]
MDGVIFLCIATVNFLALLAGKGNANVSLGIFGVMAATFVLSAMIFPVSVGMWTLLAAGCFNSIMFPTIFSLGVRDLTAREMPVASGVINTMIVGGAVVPMCMGWFTDHIGIRIALIFPVICYSYIAFFALKGSKIR